MESAHKCIGTCVESWDYIRTSAWACKEFTLENLWKLEDIRTRSGARVDGNVVIKWILIFKCYSERLARWS